MSKNCISRSPNQGFTLVELMITISVIAILSAISYVSYSAIFGKAEKSKIEYTLSNCVKSLEMYNVENSDFPTTSEYDNSLPSGCPKNGLDSKTLYEYTSAIGTSYRLTATLQGTDYVGVRVSATPPALNDSYTAQVLVVGGGGGGGTNYGGGGGGGGGVVSQSITLSSGVHSIVVGGGGSPDYPGSSSFFDSLTGKGGGAGGYLGSIEDRKNGGSGGGSSGARFLNNPNSGGDSTCYPTCIGFKGGQGGRYGGGGGGGAGGYGSDATGSVTFLKYRDTGGNGGPGYYSYISGSSVSYSSGGKGANGLYVGPCVPHGGGGGADNAGCVGIVIVSYQSNWVKATGGDGNITYTDSNNQNPRTSGPYDGGHTIHRFYTAGPHQLNVTYL